MMKVYLKFLVFGVIFGIVLVKSEVISWFRIQEMFRFQAFHMYGVIGSALVVGILSVQIIKKRKIQGEDGQGLNLQKKPLKKTGNIIGGILFGLGWAITGACPGPLYALLASGYSVVSVVILGGILGALIYGLVKSKLPH